jgi:hypothetical protein
MIFGALPAGLGSGCADHESAQAEGAYVAPPGFSAQHTKAATLSGFAFARDTSQQIVTNTVLSRREVRQAQGLAETARSDESREQLKLEATFHGTYADGMSVAVSGQPNAWLRVRPQGAQAAKGRVRNDGSLVSFEEAFPKVTSAFGANERRVEEFLVIQKEEDTPQLAYDLEPGPDFDHIEEGEGRLWAFAHDGSGLFTINPPFADDAAGKHVEGEWQLSTRPAGGYSITAKIDLKGLQYPVLLDPTFETPAWFKSTSGQPTGFAAAASTFDPSTNCSVFFGGASGATFTLLNQTHVRCGDQKWGANISTSNTPTARAYAAAGWDGSKVNVFGGFTATSAVDELWQLSLSSPGTSSGTTGSWSQVTKSGSWPAARYLHGAAWSGSKLVIFGGIDGAGNGLRDTWEWDGSSWTQICASCFGGSAGLYGFATGTVVNGATRTIYAMGGYDNPTGASGNFTRSVYQYTGSDWASVDGDPQVIPVSSQGVLANTEPLVPAGRYLHWAAGTGAGNLLIGSGLMTNSAGADTFYPDTWNWYSQATTGVSNQWLRAAIPTNTGSAPGLRESASAVFDESKKQVVLFGGSVDSTGTTTNAGLVYKGVSRSFSMTLACKGGDCNSMLFDLTATFPGLTNATSPKCSDMFAAFVQRSSFAGGQWQPVKNALGANAPAVQAAFSAGACTASFTTPNTIDNTDITDMGVRVQDHRYHAAGTICAAAADEISSGTKAACLASSGTDGNASCGDGSVAGLDGVFGGTSLDCTNYLETSPAPRAVAFAVSSDAPASRGVVRLSTARPMGACCFCLPPPPRKVWLGPA